MKNLFILLTSIASIQLLIAQDFSGPIAITDENYDKISSNRSNPTVRGTIHGASAEELDQLVISYTLVRPSDPFQVKYEAPILEDGTFTFTLPSNLPYQQIWFSLKDYAYTCLLANEALQLDFDFSKLKAHPVYLAGDGLTFSGKDGRVNQEYNSYTLYHKEKLPNFSRKFQDLDPQAPQYLSKIDSLMSIQRSVDAEFLNKNRAPATRKIAESQTALEGATYKIVHASISGTQISDMHALILPVFSITNDSYSYFQVLYQYTRRMHFKPLETYKDPVLQFRKIDALYPAPHADLIKLRINDPDVQEYAAILGTLRDHVNQTWAASYVQQEHQVMQEKAAKIQALLDTEVSPAEILPFGTPIINTSFQAALYRSETETAEDLLKTIRAALPDKLIVLDLWATWCVPCIQNMPHQKRLYEQAKEKQLPIAFVYLCTDRSSSASKWKNKIAELQQPGTHIFVSDQQMDDLFRLVNGSGYPTYIIIKPNGEIDAETMQTNRQIDIVIFPKNSYDY